VSETITIGRPPGPERRTTENAHRVQRRERHRRQQFAEKCPTSILMGHGIAADLNA
jgi:hypothetical protein